MDRQDSPSFESVRQSYRPRHVRLLMIAESPPASNGFFYFPWTIGKDHLFRETMKTISLWPQDKPLRKGIDKRSMLREFKSMGIFLLDASSFPVDKLRGRMRREAIRSQLPRLAQEVSTIDPSHIVIVKSSIFDPVMSALKESGFGSRILNKGPIPFPSHGNQQKYRTVMKRLLCKARLL